MALASKSVWVFSAFIAFASFSAAGSEVPALLNPSDFKSAGAGALRDLWNSGVSYLGCDGRNLQIPFDQVKRDADKVQVESVLAFEKRGAASRWSAFNETGKGRVYLNPNETVPPSILPGLAAHEILGALGYPDRNYEVSVLALLLKARRGSDAYEPSSIALTETLTNVLVTYLCPGKKNKDLVWQWREYANSRARIRTARGGADVVGGGGDWAAIAYKVKLAEAILTQRSNEKMVGWLRNAITLDLEILSPRSASERLVSRVSFDEKNKVVLVPEEFADDLLRGTPSAKSREAFEQVIYFIKAL